MSLKDDACALASRCLNCADYPFPHSGKVIHDAVWGSIHLNRSEVALVDTILLQRLRYLHQTGFAFLTFPSARHSRFEHSLGVLHQTDRHLRALQSRFREHVTDESVTVLRLAALLHDCSHGLFSHTSEEIYRFLPDTLEFTNEHGPYPAHKASELIARFILESPAFQQALDFLASRGAVHTSGKELTALICGDYVAISPHDRWQVEIINGPLDADKLDYIARDGLHTGLPLSVDLDRLWLSTEVQFLKKGCLKDIDQDQTRLVVNRSGISAIEGILFARFQLTSAVYQHPKIRASDCVFKTWIEELQERDGSFKRTIDFVESTDVNYTVVAGQRHRGELLKRALVISGRTVAPSDAETLPPVLITLVDEANSTAAGASRLRSLAYKIAVEAKVPEEQRKLVWIDLPPFPKVQDLGLTIVNLGTPREPKFEYLEQVFPVPDWAKMFQHRNWRGHVFAPAKSLVAVGKAAFDVLGSELGLKIQNEALTWCKLEPPYSR